MFKVNDIVEYEYRKGRFTVLETNEEWSMLDFEDGWKKIKNESLRLSEDQTRMIVNCGNGKADKCRVETVGYKRNCTVCYNCGLVWKGNKEKSENEFMCKTHGLQKDNF